MDNLKNPPKKYRPIPFWSWNEKLRVDETRRQIAEMDRVGIGGYFMHARGGLQTPYLGEEWMENIQAGIDEARERDMGAWAYDENGWPSGFGDGKVNGRGEVFQQKYLRYEFTEGKIHREDGRTITNVILEDGRNMHFYYDVNPFYVDTLDLEVTRTFLEEIYEPYYQRFQEDFGGPMPGFFTDEPQISRSGIPWSLTMTDQYRSAYGEELLPVLPQLFMEIGDYKRTRYRFWHLVQELFVTNFTQKIYDWCTEHGISLTGHMVLEETLLSQLTSNAAVMPHFEFFHMPGMDWLGRHINPPTTPLQVASVCHQLGKKQILSETFALTGWNVSFEELKWIYEWQMVRGITQLCQHLEGYSLRGIRKRDYPPSLFIQQPWWDEYRVFNDTVSRIGMLLAEGEVDYDVLVVHPQSSAWLHFNNDDNGNIEGLNRQFMEVIDALEQAHVMFHLGDERIMKRHGQVQGSTLIVGQQTYKAVIVPPVDTLSSSTVALLKAYADNGGLLIWIGQKPSLIEGVEDPAIMDLAQKGVYAVSPENAIGHLPKGALDVSVTGSDGKELAAITVARRNLSPDLAGGACRFYYFVNSDNQETFDATLRIPAAAVWAFDPMDGSIRNIPQRVENGSVVVEHTFVPMGSLALFAADDVKALEAEGDVVDLSDFTPLEAERFVGDWKITSVEPNALTLDYCDFWFDGDLQASREHVSVIQARACSLERPVHIAMKFDIQVAEDFTPEGEMYLVMEMPHLYQIKLNGRDVPNTDAGYYRDRSFRKIDIRGYLKPGLNELYLETDFSQDSDVYDQLKKALVFEAEKNKLTYNQEIEAVYLVGDFGVSTPGTFTQLPRDAQRYTGDFIISKPRTEVDIRNLTTQGFPFYNGRIRLAKTIIMDTGEVQKRSFKLKKRLATIVGLWVNGKKAVQWFWGPYEASLEGLLQPGENIVEIELIGNLRNLLGPHHLEQGESYAVAPPSFFKEANVWGHQPWNDDYCFVDFGVEI